MDFLSTIKLVLDKLSIRKIMFMIIVAFGIYLITPDFIQAWLMSKRPEFLSIPIYTTSLSVLSAFVICEVVEFFFRHITADKGEASNAEKKFNKLTTEEKMLLSGFTAFGFERLEFDADNPVVISLLSKDILENTYETYKDNKTGDIRITCRVSIYYQNPARKFYLKNKSQT